MSPNVPGPLRAAMASSHGCAVCMTNSHPEFVPASQHAIGCPVRAAQLEQRT